MIIVDPGADGWLVPRTDYGLGVVNRLWGIPWFPPPALVCPPLLWFAPPILSCFLSLPCCLGDFAKSDNPTLLASIRQLTSTNVGTCQQIRQFRHFGTDQRHARARRAWPGKSNKCRNCRICWNVPTFLVVTCRIEPKIVGLSDLAMSPRPWRPATIYLLHMAADFDYPLTS